MATSSDRLNLLDICKATDPNGKPAQVAEILNETNEVVQDAPAFPSNAALGNRVTIRSSLPTVQFTKINKGSVKSKGTFEQKVDTIGILDGRSEVDVKAKIGMGDAAFMAHRKNQDDGFVESLSQTGASNIFYGDEAANEAAFTGLSVRLGALGTALSGSKVVSAGGVGADNTSIYVVDWHERYVHLIYPEGTTGGVEVKTLGEQQAFDADNNPFTAYVTSYLWALGLTVKDPRHLGRLANIDVSDIASAGLAGYTGPDLLMKLIDVLAAMPNPNGANRVLYCNNQVWAAFHKLALSKSNSHVTMQEYLGRGLVPAMWGYPIRRCDRISNAESLVS